MTPNYVHWCIARARRALRNGDLDAAERWYKIADRAQRLEQRRKRMESEARHPAHPRFAGT